jgi:hypothetical protein
MSLIRPAQVIRCRPGEDEPIDRMDEDFSAWAAGQGRAEGPPPPAVSILDLPPRLKHEAAMRSTDDSDRAHFSFHWVRALTGSRLGRIFRGMKKVITVRLPEDLKAAAKRKAAAEGRTLSSLIEEGLRLVTDEDRKPERRRRVALPVSKARGGFTVDLTSFSAIQGTGRSGAHGAPERLVISRPGTIGRSKRLCPPGIRPCP